MTAQQLTSQGKTMNDQPQEPKMTGRPPSRQEICDALDGAIESVREWIETFEFNEPNDPNYPEASALERREEQVLLWLRNQYGPVTPSNCQQEPPYPNDATVVFSIRSPDLTYHRATPRCAIGPPHRIDECGEFTGASREGTGT